MKYKRMFFYENIFEEYKNLQRIDLMDYDTTIYKVPDIYKRVINDIFKRHQLAYADLGGDCDLVNAIEKYEAYLTGVENKEKMIFVGNGVSSLINPVIESILGLPENIKRKEILLFTTDYPLFHSAIEYSRGVPVPLKSFRDNFFLPTIEDIGKNITDNTSAIIFSNPNNPTGKVLSDEFLSDLLSLSRQKNIFIVSDEIYSEMIFEPNLFTCLPSLIGGYSNYVKLFGLSKDRPGTTGLRTGYCIGDRRLLDNLYNTQMVRNFSGNIVSESIFLIDIALRYFKLSGEKISELSFFEERDIEEYYNTTSLNEKYLKESIDLVISELKKNKNIIDFIIPEAGNSIFFEYHKKLSPDTLLYEFIKKGLAVYPSDVFGLHPEEDGSWIRFCVTGEKQHMKEMIEKI